MLNLFNHITIRTKLIFASLIPFIGLLYYLQINLEQELLKKESTQKVISDVNIIHEISKVLHEVQKERALTVTYLSAKGSRGQEELHSQWESTNRAIVVFEKVLVDQHTVLSTKTTIDSLSLVRAEVNALKSFDKIDNFYRGFKTRLLDQISVISRASENINLKNSFEEHLILLYVKEYLAQIRSELGIALSAGKFQGLGYGNFASIKGKYEINLEKFKKIASPELLAFFNRKFNGPFVDQTLLIVESAFINPDLNKATYDFNLWLNVATSSINALKEVEDFSSDIIIKKAQEEISNSESRVNRSIGIAIFITILVAFVVIFTIKGIVDSINSIKVAADKMSKGDTSAILDIKIKDEIGNLAASFNEMIIATRNFSEIANTIGQGDYSPVVKIRSEADTLGIALDRMKSNLQQLSNDNTIRTWLLTGNSELNDKLRGEKEIKSLAQDIVTQLATYLKAQIASIYLKEGDRLDLVGSYAFHHRKDNANTFKIGQGLVGQAALEKKSIMFSEIPNDYIRINSGLGNAIPKHILVFPFLYENEVKGIIELGTAGTFSALDLEFLQLASDNIAIAFNASQSRTQLQELLEETQRQAEELEAQQEELRQSNEALEQKTGMLEKSEAELKTQQEELQQTNEELEEKANLLEEQKERLGIAKMETENKARELEATGKYKSEFLANMSHELRTPLNSILILSQVLSENKSNVLGEKEVEFVKNIYSAGTDLLNLINEILDLSKVESGKMELDMEAVSFDELVGDIDAMFSEVAKSKLINFNIKINQKTVAGKTLYTDKQRLDQILRNLISNAFKFTEKNGQVTLSIDELTSSVSLKNKKLLDGTGVIAFSVSDTGIGIPEHKQGIIFEAFQQADGSTKRKYGGTGLGLSICRELASALGGEIHLTSEEGKGSIFTLYLPLVFNSSTSYTRTSQTSIPDAKEIITEPVSNESINSTGTTFVDDRNNIKDNDKTILIIEDDPAFANLLLDFVRSRNYKGIIAQQGNIGLSYARQYKPDAIMLDMKLPVLDGTAVLKQLKNDPALRHLPVQIISGYDLRQEGISLGAFDYIKKPVSKESLQAAFDKIEDFINRKLKRLLIIEDNAQQNQAICQLIGNGDVKCSSAYSGNEAIDMLKSEKFDCIIVDLGLPDMLGLELLQKVKADDGLNKIPIVVYTAKDLTKDENRVLNKLANTVVLKTVHSFDRLLDETTLFLHRVESRLPEEKQNIIRKLHKSDEVLNNKTVLVVDDDMRNIYSLTNALEEEGLHCLVAENGRAAIQMLHANEAIDIVLMDIMMPELDGYEATKEIRKMHKFDKLPIIALTAKAMKGDKEKCMAAGMSDYIAKPVNIEQLVSLMRVWLYR